MKTETTIIALGNADQLVMGGQGSNAEQVSGSEKIYNIS